MIDPERAVKERYEEAARGVEPALCCPVDYDPKLLQVIPDEILEKDYGCGDPSRYVRPGDVVLDLGSGAGKICYIASQVAGPGGRVIGLDFNTEMLALARRYKPEIATRIGHDNVSFHRARIQDLSLPLDAVDEWLAEHPVKSSGDLAELESFQARLRHESPLVPDGSVDVVISNCVLNLVRQEDRETMFREIFRVLRKGGRVAISDIVSDESVPADLRSDPELWSGCISGAFQESAFLAAFERAGFHAIAIEKLDEKPWRTVRGIEFRSMTVTARKGKQGPCLERNQAVIYRGPWRQVEDDDGHVLVRGRRSAVCDKTFRILTGEPYSDAIIPVPPMTEVPIEQAGPFACGVDSIRPPSRTKGLGYDRTTEAADSCGPGTDCC